MTILGIIWAALTGTLGKVLTAIAVPIVTAFAGWKMRGQRETIKDLKAEAKTHDRINQADTGAGLSDDDRVERLRDIGKRLGG